MDESVDDRFNPRSLHRERHEEVKLIVPVEKVSIHAPYIGSDSGKILVTLSKDVSIHAPYIGSDDGFAGRIDILKCFNPRSLHRERRRAGLFAAPSCTVSIHAPYIGSDFHGSLDAVLIARFNPRSLHRERLLSSFLINIYYRGFNPRSLHRERPSVRLSSIRTGRFQSTLPT